MNIPYFINTALSRISHDPPRNPRQCGIFILPAYPGRRLLRSLALGYHLSPLPGLAAVRLRRAVSIFDLEYFYHLLTCLPR